MPNERPILFSSEMVRAILDNRKTMTRRVVENVREWCGKPCIGMPKTGNKQTDNFPVPLKDAIYDYCPYGKVGDRLWVREYFARWSNDHSNIVYQDDPDFAGLAGQNTALNKLRANAQTADLMEPVGYWQKCSPYYMRKEHARLWLEIINIGVERVQEITADDAFNEGVRVDNAPIVAGIRVHENKPLIEEFKTLWNSINKKRGYGWDVNPYVWVIEFKRINQ